MFRNLATVIRDGTELDVKWEESVSVIEIIELARELHFVIDGGRQLRRMKCVCCAVLFEEKKNRVGK